MSEHFNVITPEWVAGRGKELRESLVVWTRLQSISVATDTFHAGRSLEYFEDVRLLCSNCTDVSHLPLEECQRRGIDVLSLKGIAGLDNVHATAEHTISLMLQALRHRCDRSSGRIGRELRGKRVGIVGPGRIGKQVNNILLWGFGCTAYPIEARDLNCKGWDRYDIISIHASLNDTSKGMVNAEFLSKLKPGAIVVNTARDAIVNHRDLLKWLEHDTEAIYAHDFFDTWQPGENRHDAVGPHPRIIGTPHIGGWTIESLHKTEELLAEKVIEWAKSKMEVSV